MDSIQPNRPTPPIKNTKVDTAAPSAQSVAKFNEAVSAPQIGSAFPTINEQQQAFNFVELKQNVLHRSVMVIHG